MVIAYGCCVGSWDKVARNVGPRIGSRPLIALTNQTSICAAYNQIIAAVPSNVDALVLLHDDLEITDSSFEQKILDTLSSDPSIALVGVAGGTGRGSLAWWNSPTIGHQLTDSAMLDFGEWSGDVAFIEGSLMVLSRWAVDYLRYDETYTEFLGYDDICLHALDAGMRVVVADIDTHHHTTLGWKSPGVLESWNRADEIFRKKWGVQ